MCVVLLLLSISMLLSVLCFPACTNLLDKGVDSLGQCCGRSKSVGEGLHVLVCVIVSGDAPEMLCSAVAEDGHFGILG